MNKGMTPRSTVIPVIPGQALNERTGPRAEAVGLGGRAMRRHIIIGYSSLNDCLGLGKKPGWRRRHENLRKTST